MNKKISDVPSRLRELREEFTGNLSNTAVNFITVGLKILHGELYLPNGPMQVALANICVGIELLAKAYVGKRNLALVFCGLPKETLALLSCPEASPERFNWELIGLDLKFATFKTAKLPDVLAMLYAFRPDLKPKLHSHTRLIQELRSTAIHSLSPAYEHHAVERAAFTALQLVAEFAETREFEFPYDFLRGRNAKFMAEFDEKRVQRVKKALEQARQSARRTTSQAKDITADDWETMVGACPICEGRVLLGGYTDLEAEENEPGEWDAYLVFLADRLECATCGLILEDSREMELAGVETKYVREEQVHEWADESSWY